jgi:hypothetical protein
LPKAPQVDGHYIKFEYSMPRFEEKSQNLGNAAISAGPLAHFHHCLLIDHFCLNHQTLPLAHGE